MPVLLVCTALLNVVGAPLASAAVTDTVVDFNCVAHAPIVGDTAVAQQLTFSTNAPAEVEAGANFSAVVSPGPITIPTEQSPATISSITNVKMRIPVPANAQFISASLSGGANNGSGTPSVALQGSIIEVSIPGPLAAGAVVTPPVVTAVLKATGPVGSTIQTRISGAASPQGYTLTVNSNFGAIPTECVPAAPNPALATATIVDHAAPTITFNTPAAGAGYGLDAAVAASYSCNDHGGSGVASCVGTLANGANIDTSTLGSHSFSVTATDNSGNTATETINYNVVVPSGDTTPPVITLTSPTNGSLYTQGQAVAANFACTDNIAMGACTGTVANGANINTSSPGPKSFTVNATDAAGNTASETVGYYVSAGGATTTGPKNVGTLSASGSGNVDGANVFVKVSAPAPNGGTIPVGTVLTVDYQVYKPHGGLGSNGGPDPTNWTLQAPSNSKITGNVTVNESGINGETHGDAYGISGNTGLKSLTPANPQVNGSSVTVSYDGRSYQALFDCCNNDGILIHVQFQALVTTPGQVTIKGFSGLTGTDPTFPSGPYSTTGITDAQVGIGYTAVDITPPTIAITAPINGSLYTVGQVVNAAFTCSDNVGVSTCVGTKAVGQPVDTSTSGPHSFQVTATDAAGNTAVKTVSYSVAVPTMDIAGCTANEGANCTFTVTLSNPSSQNVSVNYATADGTATAPGRYAATSGVVTFTPGQTSKQVPVATVAAGTQQLDQTFTMTLTSPVAATLGTDTATGTVHDVSSTPKLVGQAATVHRAGLVTNTVIASVPVVLSNQFGQPQTSGLTVTANWSTLDWSAHAPQDYTAASGTLTYLPGETIKYIDVQVPYSALASLDRVGFILVDHMVNATPGGFVNLEAASPYTIAFFGITTDNPWPVLSMNNVTASVPAGGAAWVTFTVDQSAPLSDDLRGVTFTTADGTAVAGSDYDARTGTILWAPNAAGSRTVSVRVHPTGAAGTSKTVKLVLSNVGGPATLHATKYIATATINIT